MDFGLTSEQRMIKETVERFVTESYGFDRRQAIVSAEPGFDRANWRTFAELGWLGVGLAEEHGGFGGGPLETMLVMEAFGAGLVAEPYLPAVVLAGTALALGGSHPDEIAALIEGDRLLSLGYAEEASRYDESWVETELARDGGDLILRGKKIAVPFAAAADSLVVSARSAGAAGDRDGVTLVLVDAGAAGVVRSDYRTIDGLRASDVTFDDVRLPRRAVVGETGAGLAVLERTIDHGIAALAAEAVGIMTVMLRTTVAYLKSRTQFDVPIGSFQALQHRAADMAVALELARSIVDYGTHALSDESADNDRRRALAATKVQIGRSGRFIGQQAVQLHGAIGVSEEYLIGHYFARLTAIGMSLGDTDHSLSRFAAAHAGHAHELRLVRPDLCYLRSI